MTDFTWMTDREIDKVVRAAGNNLCGRFRPDQLRRPIRAAVLPATGWRAAVAATALLLGGGAVERTIEPPITGEIGPSYTEQVATPVINTFRARIISEYGEGIAGARVTVVRLEQSVTTDDNGYFTLDISSGDLLSVQREGYLSRTISIVPGDTGFTETGNSYELFEEAMLLGEVISVVVAPPLLPLTYRARIVDEAGDPLIGASVRIMETTRGTVTDIDGSFELIVDPGAVLFVSYIGHEPLEITPLADDTGYGNQEGEFMLLASATDLEQIVVTGYGVVGKMNIMGAVSTLTQSCELKSMSPDPLDESAKIVPVDVPDYSVYPNPFTDRLTVSFRAGNAGAKSARLFNITGQVVQQWPTQRFEVGPAELRFPLLNHSLVAGQYILRLEDASGEQESLIVIKR